jgi:hypothetical protein
VPNDLSRPVNYCGGDTEHRRDAMESSADLMQMAQNLVAQAFFVLFVWRMARRLAAAGRGAQERDGAPGGLPRQGLARKSDLASHISPES